MKLPENMVVAALLGESLLDDLPKYVSISARQKFLQKKGFYPENSGSSRTVYAIDKKHVLKLAHNEAGFKQNQIETRRYAQSPDKTVLARVIKASPDGAWIVAERVKPFESEEEFEQVVGFPAHLLKNLENCEAAVNGSRGLANQIAQQEEWLKLDQEKYERYKAQDLASGRKSFRKEYKPDPYTIARIEAWKKMQNSKFFNSLCVQADNISGNILDLSKFDHYGMTVDGRPVLLDYGVDYELAGTHYRFNAYADQAKWERDQMDNGDWGETEETEDEFGHPLPPKPKPVYNPPVQHIVRDDEEIPF